MKRWGQFAVAVLALVVGLGTVLYAQLWVSSGSGVSTAGTMTVSGATALNGGLTMDSTAFTVANTTGNVATTGTLTVSNAGPHVFSAGSAGEVALKVVNTTNGAASFSGLRLGTNASNDRHAVLGFPAAFTPAGGLIADGISVVSAGVGGVNLYAADAAADVRIYTGGANLRTTFDDAGNISHTGRYNSATLQPGFLAYNSTGDNAVSEDVALDFDTELYDSTSSFANDIFTAPVAGMYLFCASVSVAPDDGSTASLRVAFIPSSSIGSASADIVSSAQTITWEASYASCFGPMSMAASDTMVIRNGTPEALDVGAGSWFSGRLVP